MECQSTSLSYKTAIVCKFLCRSVLLVLFSVEALFSEPISSSELGNRDRGYVCLGYDRMSQTWGYYRGKGVDWILCPRHYAFFGIAKPFGGNKEVAIYGNCCRLPREDIVTAKEVYVDSVCPDGYIVTGYEIRDEDLCTDCLRRLVCNEINTQKYQLTSPRSGMFWGMAVSVAFPWDEIKRIRRDQLPLALRFGLSRYTRTYFAESGCVGNPVGSLLVGKSGSECQDTLWAILLEKGETESEAKWRPVTMYPECSAIDNLFSEEDPREISCPLE
jgi:hypothetical protein